MPGDRGEAGAEGLHGVNGRDGSNGMHGEKGDRGETGAPGKLPKVKAYVPGAVFYDGDVVTTGGGLFQASCDTGQAPPHSDWIVLALPGRDGKSPTVRGTFDPNIEYRELDIVAFNKVRSLPAATSRARVPATVGNC